MKISKKAIAVTAVSGVLLGGLAFASPGLAHEIRGGDKDYLGGSQHSEGRDHNGVSLESSIVDIPTDVTTLREAVKGAYFTAYQLDSAVLPAAEPAEGGRFVGIRPERSEDGSVIMPEIAEGVVTANLGLKAGNTAGTSYIALYPADGSKPTLVTVVVSADGIATASASNDLTVAYNAEVAAAAPEMGPRGMRSGLGEGHGEGRGHREMRGEHNGGHFDHAEETDDSDA